MPLNINKITDQATMLENRIRKRFHHLKKWAQRINIDAFRIYDRDIPEIPLVLDWYNGFIAGSFYERPYEVPELEELLWLNTMKHAISHILEIDAEHIYIRKRQRIHQYQRLPGNERWVNVHENDLIFHINVSNYVDTGLFLDRRALRFLIRNEVYGKKVLNLFCYTAAFSVAAARGGAESIDSVDLSNTYLEWAYHNFNLNAIPVYRVNSLTFLKNKYQLIRAEVRHFLNEAQRHNIRWDYIILDAPTFSNSKRMQIPLDISRDYPQLIHSCLSLLNSNGTLWFSTNTHRFHCDETLFPGFMIQNYSEKLRMEDFCKKLPYCFKIQKVGVDSPQKK
ncbi:MAG: class I SAM-dependent methyltransferase [Treponema sp.]|jgi:23S rRNA G2069 N7-methylase RlmK/C1962 C5-methylase RlmI|nr:class I SAM-dependent methyltransferase [Treponema sp.]